MPTSQQLTARRKRIQPANCLAGAFVAMLVSLVCAETLSAQSTDSDANQVVTPAETGTQNDPQVSPRVDTPRATGTRIDGFAAPNDQLNRLSELFVEPQVEPEQPRNFRDRLHDRTGLKFGFMVSHLLQGTTESLPDKDRVGLATISAALVQWDVCNRGTPTEGQFHLGLEARWDYGFASPFEIGFDSIGSAIGTADPYDAYNPAVVVRDLFFRQGGEQAGWGYRIGKITTDRLLTTSAWLDPTATFLPVGTNGSSSIALPDSGFGAALGLYLTDRLRLGGVISDANGDRFSFGAPGRGDSFKAVELQTQILPPLTQQGGYSTFTLWHTDGTSDGAPIGSSTGRDGWGYFIKLERELTRDGKNIGILRFGESFDGAAVYDAQASIRYVRIDPPDPLCRSDDLFGIAYGWVDPVINPTGRDENGFDMFYRFTTPRNLDVTLAYQGIFNPAFNADDDFAGVISLRLRRLF